MKPFRVLLMRSPTTEASREEVRPALSKIRLVDSLFTGAGVLPAAVAIGGRIDIAMMMRCPLLIAACLTAAWLEPAGLLRERHNDES